MPHSGYCPPPVARASRPGPDRYCQAMPPPPIGVQAAEESILEAHEWVVVRLETKTPPRPPVQANLRGPQRIDVGWQRFFKRQSSPPKPARQTPSSIRSVSIFDRLELSLSCVEVWARPAAPPSSAPTRACSSGCRCFPSEPPGWEKRARPRAYRGLRRHPAMRRCRLPHSAIGHHRAHWRAPFAACLRRRPR